MSETPNDPKPPSDDASPAPDGVPTLNAMVLFGVLAAGAWVWTVITVIIEKSDVDDVADRFDPSAIQISQLVDQALLKIAVPASVALALSVIFVAVALGTIASRLREMNVSR